MGLARLFRLGKGPDGGNPRPAHRPPLPWQHGPHRMVLAETARARAEDARPRARCLGFALLSTRRQGLQRRSRSADAAPALAFDAQLVGPIVYRRIMD